MKTELIRKKRETMEDLMNDFEEDCNQGYKEQEDMMDNYNHLDDE